MKFQDEHEQELQRQVEMRLREMESNIGGTNAPFHKTVKHQPENLQQPWMKKAILAAKLFGLGVAVLVAVRVASVLAGIVMFAALAWLTYKLFFESKKN
ncbi:hypothetical protein NIES4074_55340 [Cylindrospermum sp. NIES-4074]|jgi:hypothetical protein|nr:hypothetical protein NIES4074_55340 [Cylindrospermum sp. NIES-4074]